VRSALGNLLGLLSDATLHDQFVQVLSENHLLSLLVAPQQQAVVVVLASTAVKQELFLDVEEVLIQQVGVLVPQRRALVVSVGGLVRTDSLVIRQLREPSSLLVGEEAVAALLGSEVAVVVLQLVVQLAVAESGARYLAILSVVVLL
jgi:hypothetical protein